MKKWRIDWSTYNTGYKIIDAGTEDEAKREISRDSLRGTC